MTAARNPYIDSVKGILIILVVFGHLLQTLIDNSAAISQLYTFIYLFHMPGFIFIAGMFSKSALDATRIGKLIRNIVAPLLLFTILYEAGYVGIHGELSRYTEMLEPFWILWFLLSLFCWRLFAPILLRSRAPLVIAVIIGIVTACADESGYYLGLSRTFVFLPLFMFGMLYGSRIVARLLALRPVEAFADVLLKPFRMLLLARETG